MAMTNDDTLRTLLTRIRAGDQQAATQLVRRYEPALRRAVRLRLRDRQLRRLLDSSDICQSVLLRFFVRVAGGQYELETPEQVLKLLTTLARNQVVNEALQQQAAKRDCRRQVGAQAGEWEAIAPGSSPSQHVAVEELQEKARVLLGPHQWDLLQLRKEGWEWVDIARQRGGTAEGLRKQLERAVARVTHTLGLVEVGHASSQSVENEERL
jgi:RNA polymerase sigma-70 factor (ECF subfamily)